jgi:hypothetical protein
MAHSRPVATFGGVAGENICSRGIFLGIDRAPDHGLLSPSFEHPTAGAPFRTL